MATQDQKDLLASSNKTFYEAVLKNLKIEAIRRVITTPLPKNAGFPEYDEYADYRDLSILSMDQAAEQLGSGVATLYNALISNAVHSRQHKVVTDLFENNNLRFNAVINDTPSVADPAALIKGWVSFRFHFKSSNERPESLSANQSMLSKLEARPRY